MSSLPARRRKPVASPAWRGRKPTAKDRARYRQFEASLDDKQRLELAYAFHKRP